MMTPEEVALMLAISVQEASNLLGKANGIPAFNVQGKKRVWRSSVIAFLERNPFVDNEEVETQQAEDFRDTLIVTKAKGLAEWLVNRGIRAPVVEAMPPEDMVNLKIIGMVNYNAATFAESITLINLRNKPTKKPIYELTPREIDASGPDPQTYTVKRIPNLVPVLADMRKMGKDPLENIIILARSMAMVQWLNSIGIFGQVVSRIPPQHAIGKYLIGDVPYFLAASAQGILNVRFNKPIPSYMREETQSLQDFLQGNPELISYEVQRVDCPFPVLLGFNAEPKNTAIPKMVEPPPSAQPVKPHDELKQVYKERNDEQWEPRGSQRPLSQEWGHGSDDRVPAYIPHVRPNPASRPPNTEDIGKQIERAADRNGKFRVTRGRKNDE